VNCRREGRGQEERSGRRGRERTEQTVEGGRWEFEPLCRILHLLMIVVAAILRLFVIPIAESSSDSSEGKKNFLLYMMTGSVVSIVCISMVTFT